MPTVPNPCALRTIPKSIGTQSLPYWQICGTSHDARIETLMNLLLIQIVTTVSMTAVIWFVQLVQYPSFAKVGAAGFPDFHALHSARITFIVAPLMIAEAVSAIALVWRPTSGVASWEVWAGLGLLVIIWASTFLLQVPMHTKLGGGFDADAWRFLVRSNWVRTIAWSLRAGLVIVWLQRALDQALRLGLGR
jgi:hypothetical protein